MTDPRNILQSMFGTNNRFANFGNLIVKMRVKGFRCHADTTIDIDSPITAFCGMNGTGKSTLLQLAASCYASPDPVVSPYYLRDFIVVGPLDPTPFTANAAVEYKYLNDTVALKTLTLSRNAHNSRWQGYTRRPKRLVYFAGIGLYLPKIEQRDFFVRHASHLQLLNRENVSTEIKEWTCKILGVNYEEVCSHNIRYANQTKKVGEVKRSGVSYSEAHMGFGEGRSLYLIHMLEEIPNQSLVLIEEPETSLHPYAQHQFGKYLVDVTSRKHHQVLLTTHSEFILEALHSQSRIYLYKTGGGISSVVGLTSLQAKSLMDEGIAKALNVLVEDNVGLAVLREIVRRVDPEFLKSIGIYVGGDENVIATVVRTLRPTGIPLAAVRDGDMAAIPHENIFKLPGTLPPEKEMFQSLTVKALFQDTYNVNLDDFAATINDVDHHEWFARLAQRINQDESALIMEASRAYVGGVTDNDRVSLVTLLKETTRR